jgi:hypothetical protein
VVDRRWLAVDVAVKVATVLLLLVAVARPDLPQFAGKAFQGRAVAYPLALLVVPIGWWLLGRPRGLAFPVAADILLGLPFLIDVAGNALNLYDSIDWWDDANHLVNWFVHTAAIAVLLRLGSWGRWTRVGLAVAWAASTAILWEIAEFALFVRGSPELATAYSDTIGDLALGLLGGTIAALLVGGLAAPRVRLEPQGGATRAG